MGLTKYSEAIPSVYMHLGMGLTKYSEAIPSVYMHLGMVPVIKSYRDFWVRPVI